MGNTPTTSRKVFEQLDKEKCGRVNLQEILLSDTHTSDVPMLCSLATLYHFDQERTCSLNFKEYSEMEKFVHSIQKQAMKQESHHYHQSASHQSETPQFFQRFFKAKSSSHLNDMDHHHHHHHHDSDSDHHLTIQTNNGGSSNNLYAPQLSPMSSTSAPVSPVDGYVSMFNSPKLFCHNKKSTKDIHLQLRNKITIALLPTLNKEMYGAKNRKHFIEWLFKLADIGRVNSVSEADLSIILRAVQRDGINLSGLLFDEPEEDDDVVHKIMQEYNVTDTGYLSKSEFFRLADVILNLYEGRFQLNNNNDELYGNIVCSHYRMLYTLGKGSYGIVKYAEKVVDESDMIDYDERDYSSSSSNSTATTIGGAKAKVTSPRSAAAADRSESNNTATTTSTPTGKHEESDDDEEDDSRRAIKVVKKGNVSELSQLDIEIQAMQMLKHPSVVRLYSVDSDDLHIYLEMELCGGGSLYEHLQNGPFPEPLARFYFHQLITGLIYCHNMGVCHRDLRLENLLMDNDGNVKITDFGQARIFRKGWDLFSTQLVGSLYHLSPEQIRGEVYSGEKVDTWSSGIILYCFVTGRLPFNEADVTQMFEDIKSINYGYLDSDRVSPEARDLIRKMLCSDPDDRVPLDQILLHPWMQGEKKRAQLVIENFEISSWFKRFKDVESAVRTLTTILCENLACLGCHFKLCPARTDHEILMKEIIDELEEQEQDMIEMNGEKPTQEKFDKLELPHVTPIATKPLVVIKCISTKRNMKFAIFAERTIDESLFIVFHLREGETKEFKELLHKLKKELKKIA